MLVPSNLSPSILDNLSKYEELDCDKLRNGIIYGCTSIFILIISLLSYLANCCQFNICIKFAILVSSLSILVSSGYNAYLYDNRSIECKNQYKEHDIEKYYNYFLIALLINSILIILIGLCLCMN